ncbi:MAG: peptidase M61 [Novosphingobium sp.]
MLRTLAVLAFALTLPAAAQETKRSAPAATPLPAAIPDAVDAPYPGTIQLKVDASDTARRVFRVTETIPLAPGTRSLTLLYPEWLPGAHAPRGRLAELTDLRFTAGGKPLEWRRDPVEVYAFHVTLPEGARELTAKFVYTSPLREAEGRVVFTDAMQNLQWEKVSLYPAGHYVRRIRIKPAATFPAGWSVATALDGQSASGATVTWAETDYETLVDSPLFAGRYFRQWDLGNRATLNVVADEAPQLEATPAQIAAYKALVAEALLAFGSRHFDRYQFLLALTDEMGSIGLEHHRSSENQLEPKAFTEWDKFGWDRTLLAHELTHSWNGKFRRPAGLWTPDYRQPMIDNLLWVYEGQTQFWGIVLGARAGLVPKEMALGQLASVAGGYAEQPGRGWRSVEDTTFDPIFAGRKAKPYLSLARTEDYYNEGALVWLEADQVIRRGTGGRKGIDDFAKAFFGIRDGDWGQVTYTFDDVVAALNAVYPQDWAGFLRRRIEQPGQPAPLGGIEAGGYRLAWRDTPNPYDKGRTDFQSRLDLTHSLGVTLDKDGTVLAVRWDSPGFNAGVVTGAKIVAVGGRAYDADRLKGAIVAGKGGAPIELLVQRGDAFRTVTIAYREGLRWPWLERAGGGEAGLDRLLAPRRAGVDK